MSILRFIGKFTVFLFEKIKSTGFNKFNRPWTCYFIIRSRRVKTLGLGLIKNNFKFRKQIRYGENKLEKIILKWKYISISSRVCCISIITLWRTTIGNTISVW